MTTELEPVTEGEDLTVEVQDIEDSEYGGLMARRQKIFPTERRNIMITRWIDQAKADLLRRTNRTWSYFIADGDIKTQAFETIVHMVGIRILKRAQAARVDVTETDYLRQIADVKEIIEHRILNFEDPNSPITVSNVEPDLVDPDEDYSYDT